MADDATVRQDILNKTLQEIALEDEDGTNPCVICLDAVSEAAIAIPCRHDNFDFLCLASWLQQRRVCPLCMLFFMYLSFIAHLMSSRQNRINRDKVRPSIAPGSEALCPSPTPRSCRRRRNS